MKKQVIYIRHLNDFYDSLQENSSLHANHISLYFALIRIWKRHEFENPFTIRKDEVLKLSRIGSRSTYQKCLRRLDELKYIVYHPSKVPYSSSAITMLPLGAHSTPSTAYNSPPTYTEISPHTFSVPDMEDVIALFLAAGETATEACRFFYYNQAIKWLLGEFPVSDWKAAANKWIENTPSTKPNKNAKPGNNKRQRRNTSETKDYDQPL